MFALVSFLKIKISRNRMVEVKVFEEIFCLPLAASFVLSFVHQRGSLYLKEIKVLAPLALRITLGSSKVWIRMAGASIPALPALPKFTA